MPRTMTIRNVPDQVRNELAARAARAGQSLQEYMLGQVTRLASKPSMEELVDRMRDDKRQAATVLDRESILADLHADRR